MSAQRNICGLCPDLMEQVGKNLLEIRTREYWASTRKQYSVYRSRWANAPDDSVEEDLAGDLMEQVGITQYCKKETNKAIKRYNKQKAEDQKWGRHTIRITCWNCVYPCNNPPPPEILREYLKVGFKFDQNPLP